MVPVNYVAVIVCALVAMVIGFLWYGPVFGKQWVAAMGMSQKDMEDAMKRGMAKNYAIMALGALVMAFVLSHALVFASSYLAIDGINAGLMAGFWNWLGFVVPVSLGTVLWEGKPWKLWFLNAGYYLIVLLAEGVILSLWM